MTQLHVLHGGVENGDKEDIEELAASGGTVDIWTAPRNAQPGDEAVIYVSGYGFFATATVTSNTEPHPRRQHRYSAGLRSLELIEPPLPLFLVRERLPDFGWARYPRASMTLDTEVAQQVRALIRQHRTSPVDGTVRRALPPLYSRCVYTCVKLASLEERYLSEDYVFTESRAWTTAARYLATARERGEQVPVFLSNADGVGELYFWGFLQEIRIADTEPRTTFTVDCLRRFVGPMSDEDAGIPLSDELTVASTKKALPRSRIYPYSLCRTPKHGSLLYSLMETYSVSLADEQQLVEEGIRYTGSFYEEEASVGNVDRVIWTDELIELEWLEPPEGADSESQRFVKYKGVAHAVGEDTYRGLYQEVGTDDWHELELVYTESFEDSEELQCRLKSDDELEEYTLALTVGVTLPDDWFTDDAKDDPEDVPSDTLPELLDDRKLDHYVAYHKETEFGPYDREGPLFRHNSGKSRGELEATCGKPVWVFSGQRESGRMEYRLCSVFVPDSVADSGDSRVIQGNGVAFAQPVPVANLAWFEELKREQANFSRGISRIDSERVINALVTYVSGVDPEQPLSSIRTDESFRLSRGRVGQSRFSAAVRLNYGNQCCFPGCDVAEPEFLVGAHIARWADVEHLRGDVANGLCLCLMHDKAFELGLFTLDDDYRVVIPNGSSNKWAQHCIEPFAGKAIRVGEVRPSVEAMRHHRSRVG